MPGEDMHAAPSEELDFLRRTFDGAPDAQLLVDGTGTVRLANAAAGRLLGVAPEALLGTGLGELLAGPEEAGTSLDPSRTSAPEVMGEDGDWRVRRADADPLAVRVAAAPLRIGGERQVVLTLVPLPVAAHAPETLSGSERKFRVLVDSAPLCIHEIDLEGRLVSMNRAGLRMIDATLDQICGLEYLSFVNEEKREEVQQLLEGAIRGETSFFTFEVEVADGTHTFSSCFAPILDEDGRVERLMGITEDITSRVRAERERTRVEQQMLHAQKLESLGVLAGGIAHDFSNLLMGVMGNASLALRGCADPDQREYLEAIEASSVRASELCKQLLAYAGKGQFDLRPIDLSGAVEEMTSMLSVSISKSADLRYELAPDLPAVEVDNVQLRQVIMNLILNASDALGGERGTITVRTGVSDLPDGLPASPPAGAALEPGSYVHLEVEDTGCGLDERARAQMFDPFFTTKRTGRGLGLAATLGVVRSHGGAIECRSTPGEGTTIRVLLRAVPGLAPAASSPKGDDAALRGEGLVLVVDDEETVRSVTSRMLERSGFQVVTANTGEEGLAVYLRQRDEISLVVVDLVMPGMRGDAVVAELRRLDPDLPIVLSSGYDEGEACRVHELGGPAGFLQKPYDLSRLRDVLREVGLPG